MKVTAIVDCDDQWWLYSSQKHDRITNPSDYAILIWVNRQFAAPSGGSGRTNVDSSSLYSVTKGFIEDATPPLVMMEQQQLIL